MNQFLPPLVMPLVEEPMATGGVQTLQPPDEVGPGNVEPNRKPKYFLPPLMTPLVEEPMAMGGR